jgi:ABC-type Fe3+ transport system permease subunit
MDLPSILMTFQAGDTSRHPSWHTFVVALRAAIASVVCGGLMLIDRVVGR